MIMRKRTRKMKRRKKRRRRRRRRRRRKRRRWSPNARGGLKKGQGAPCVRHALEGAAPLQKGAK